MFSVELCAQCRRETVPGRRRPAALVKDAHRGAAKGMVDRDAEQRRAKLERKAARREGKRSQRSLTREIGILGALKVSLAGRQLPAAPPPSENCPRCLKRRKRLL